MLSSLIRSRDDNAPTFIIRMDHRNHSCPSRPNPRYVEDRCWPRSRLQPGHLFRACIPPIVPQRGLKSFSEAVNDGFADRALL